MPFSLASKFALRHVSACRLAHSDRVSGRPSRGIVCTIAVKPRFLPDTDDRLTDTHFDPRAPYLIALRLRPFVRGILRSLQPPAEGRVADELHCSLAQYVTTSFCFDPLASSTLVTKSSSDCGMLTEPGIFIFEKCSASSVFTSRKSSLSICSFCSRSVVIDFMINLLCRGAVSW